MIFLPIIIYSLHFNAAHKNEKIKFPCKKILEERFSTGEAPHLHFTIIEDLADKEKTLEELFEIIAKNFLSHFKGNFLYYSGNPVDKNKVYCAFVDLYKIFLKDNEYAHKEALYSLSEQLDKFFKDKIYME